MNLRVNCLLTDLIIKNTYIQTSYGLKNYSTFHLLLILKTIKKEKVIYQRIRMTDQNFHHQRRKTLPRRTRRGEQESLGQNKSGGGI